jgi:hypothetical protein
MEWRKHWDDVKGNVKYGAGLTVLGLLGTGAMELTNGLLWWQRLGVGFVIFLMVLWAGIATWKAKQATERTLTATVETKQLQSTPDSTVRLTILQGAFAEESAGPNAPWPYVFLFLKVRVLSSVNTTLDGWKLSLFHGETLLTPTNLEYAEDLGFQGFKKPTDQLPPKIELVWDNRLHTRFQNEPTPVNNEVEDWIVFAIKNNTPLDQVFGADFKLSVYDGKGNIHDFTKRPGSWMKRVEMLRLPRPTNARTVVPWENVKLAYASWGIEGEMREVTEHLLELMESKTKDLRASYDFFADKHHGHPKLLMVEFFANGDFQTLRKNVFKEGEPIVFTT